MKKMNLSVLILALCLLLCACVQNQEIPDQNDPTISGNEQTMSPDDDTANVPDDGETNEGDTSQTVYPAELMVELVVEWEAADALLSQLDDLSDLLQKAIEEAGCPLDRVTLTISTAGGFTAQALIQGGIDAAIVPAVDIISYEKSTAILALSEEEIAETAIALSRVNSDITEDFCQILFKALMETQSGQDFLSTCCGSAVFSAPTQERLEAVRDYLRQLEEAEGGYMQ